jgi:cold-inducible RNA-binding protein
MSSKLFVGNLSESINQTDLEQLFAPHGTVHTATVIRDLLSGRSRGFGFVVLDNPTEARAALNALNGKAYRGQALRVEEARPKVDGIRKPGTFWGRR